MLQARRKLKCSALSAPSFPTKPWQSQKLRSLSCSSSVKKSASLRLVRSGWRGARPSGRDTHLLNIAVAWPTVALFLAAASTHAWVLWDQVVAPSPTLHVAAAVALLTLTSYINFTPMHDAAHGAIFTTASGLKWANHAIGSLCAVPLMAPFAAFRYVHLEHHRHVNHPTKDPDHWSGSGPTWLLPFKWATQNRYYEYLYIRLLLSGTRKWTEAVEAGGTFVAVYAALGCAYAYGHGSTVATYWLLPATLAITFLAFSFDYLPHRPHAEQDRGKSTGVLDTGSPAVNAALDVLLLSQNNHHVHHAFPWLPFYRYGAIHSAHSQDFAKAGVPRHTFLPICPSRPKTKALSNAPASGGDSTPTSSRARSAHRRRP